ncbi:relaxase/mobilization nuclease domain-containing protein (plasmid) [Campylobacter coli]
MICKFFKEHKGGGVASINYLLDKRTLQGTARVLKGDEFLTRELIKSMSQKHKTCMGVLSFEEENIKEEHKKEIMESFENALLTQEMQGRYNILWVEHTDKGRLELNFVIPKIDLESKKAFNPYFHKADNKRIEIWGDFVNLCYGFTNPKDPKKNKPYKEVKKPSNFLKIMKS